MCVCQIYLIAQGYAIRLGAPNIHYDDDDDDDYYYYYYYYFPFRPYVSSVCGVSVASHFHVSSSAVHMVDLATGQHRIIVPSCKVYKPEMKQNKQKTWPDHTYVSAKYTSQKWSKTKQTNNKTENMSGPYIRSCKVYKSE